MRSGRYGLTTGAPVQYIEWDSGRSASASFETDGEVRLSWGDGTVYGEIATAFDAEFVPFTAGTGRLKLELLSGSTATVYLARTF